MAIKGHFFAIAIKNRFFFGHNSLYINFSTKGRFIVITIKKVIFFASYQHFDHEDEFLLLKSVFGLKSRNLIISKHGILRSIAKIVFLAIKGYYFKNTLKISFLLIFLKISTFREKWKKVCMSKNINISKKITFFGHNALSIKILKERTLFWDYFEKIVFWS